MKKFSDIVEARGDTVVVAFGRFNPPTTGHEKLIEKVMSESKKTPGAPHFIYASHSENPKKDPLPYSKKIAYMKKMFPKHSSNIVTSSARTIFEMATELYNKGFRNLIMVAGSDRVSEFDGLLNKYNNVKSTHGFYNFESISVVNAGERDPDSEGVEGMSASKMRAAASQNNFEQFKLGLPRGFSEGKKLFADVRTYMGIRESFAPRPLQMTQEEVIRDLYIRGEVYNVGDIVEDNYTGVSGAVIRRGTNYLVFAEEDGTAHKKWLYEVKQDKDIKDREGTEPAKYYAKDADGDEMSVSTKKKRAAHFAKSKDGPAPGDKDADTKPSNHTKKFNQMFGEARAKQAVSQGKVQKLVTAHGLKFNGKVYKEIDMELKGIDNNTKMVTFNIIHPKEIFGNEVKLAFKVLSRGPFMATDTSKINEDFQLDEKIEGLVTKAEKSGMPYSILKKVYDRGMVAWKTGHRPGTTPQQWAFARVNSFVTKSSGTWGKADKDLAQQVRGEETVEDPREVGTDARRKATQEMTPGQKVFSFTEHVNCGTPDCCNQCNTSSLIESNQYRVGSEMYFEFFNDKRKLMSEGKLSPVGFDKDLLEGDIGQFAMFEGQNVPLDCPMIEEEKDVELNKPKVGGPKKYYVYVKDGDKVKKVTWGDTTGLKVKLNDLGARKSFAARHRCDQQKDRTTAAYWACNLPRYADQLGLSGGGNFFW